MATEAEVREYVQAGAEWLDEVRPAWPEMIDFGILKMWDGSKCVAGQVFADKAVGDDDGYCYLFNRYGADFVVEHGFIGFDDPKFTAELWRDQVEARTGAWV